MHLVSQRRGEAGDYNESVEGFIPAGIGLPL